MGGTCILSIWAFCYMWNLFGVTLFYTSIVNQNGGGRCILSICAFCYMWKLFGLVEFCISIVNWQELFLILLWYVFTIYMFLVRGQFFCIVFAMCDYTCGSLKVVPWCSNTLDCWWKDMSKVVRGRNSPHSILIDLVQKYVIRWCMYIFVNSHCK